jgi:hypothetical protein
MKEFWVSSGHHLTERDSNGLLAVTDELLLGLLARPEVVPPEEACDAERALYQSLLQDPRQPVDSTRIALLADADARENWEFLIRFRNVLLENQTIEGAYLAIIRQEKVDFPPIFMAQLVHLILRNALDGTEDPILLRAAELLFRPQKATLQDGHILLADLDLIEDLSVDPHQSPLLAMMGEQKIRELDVITPDNAYDYWSRSDAFSMVLDFSKDYARKALARAMQVWISHLTGVTTEIEPIETLQEKDWRWFIGLDSTGTRVGNALWKGEWMPDELQQRAVAFFNTRITSKTPLLQQVEGHPITLIMGMTSDSQIMLKPQNLIAGLPLARKN